MFRPTRLLSLLLLGLCLRQAAAAPQAASAAKPRESAKYGLFLLGSRVGSMTTQTFDTSHLDRPALRVDAESSIKLAALGAVEMSQKMSTLTDTEGKPISTRFVITSLARTTTIDARYEPDRIVCSVDAGGQKSMKTVPIPKGVSLTVDPEIAGRGSSKTLKVGAKETLHFFEPMTMSIQSVEMEVVKSDTRTVAGKPVPAFLVKSTNSITGASQSWVDIRGRLLENNTSIGLRIVREDVPTGPATAATYTPPPDFAVATSVRTDVKLEEPRKIRSLKLKVIGIPDPKLVLSDIRQQVVERKLDGTAVTATYSIQTRELPAAALPAVPGAAQPELADAPYLGVSDPTIQKQAKDLSEAAADRAAIARRIRAWVKGHMEKPTNVGTPRSAPEIMRSRDGVCRDFATLFAAVARAAGVPTRLCSGIVYFQGGFFYHAWVECQLTAGDDGWFALDPTQDNDFVDATHVKFAQGDPTDMFAAVRVVGQIKAEILGYE